MYEEIIEHFKSLPPIKTENDIPELPILPEDVMKQIIPELHRIGCIPKKDLIPGKRYFGNCRNTDNAVWDGEKFIYKRLKFGYYYEDTINHFEDDDGYDLFIPIKEYE